MKTEFKKGNVAVVTQRIRRVDGKSCVEVGETVEITSVYEGSDCQIVSIRPFSGKPHMVDIYCNSKGPLKLGRVN